MCSSSLAQGLGVIQENADGGAFFAWVHAQNLDIVAHRVDGTGSPVFPKTNGLVVTACGNAVEPSIAEDGVGGVFIAWSTGGSTADVYIQRLNSDGLQYWAGGGEVVCNWVLEQTKPMVLSDGAEGAYVVWQDYRSQVSVKVYAQRFTATGEKAWGAYPNGMPVCVATGNQSSPKLISDGSDGIISLWTDSRTGSDMYAQRIDAAGNMQWANDGVLFVSAVGSPWSYLADGAGGVIATHAVPNVYDIVAHRFSAAGSALWPGGVTLCNAANNQLSPVLASDGAGGAIVAWVDYRANPSAGDIYAQRVAAGGQIPTAVETPAFAGALDLSANQPNPFNAETAFTLTLGKRSDVTIEVFDVAGHRVRRAAMRDVDAGSRRISFDGKDAAGNALPSGVYFYRVRAAGETLTRKMVIAR